MAAQIVHAAGESAISRVPSNTNAVVLAVPNQDELFKIAHKFQILGIPHILIRETDEPYSGQVTAIGVAPLSDRRMVKKILSNLKLLGRNIKQERTNEGSGKVQSLAPAPTPGGV